MATKLNLATKPFSNRSLPWVVTTLLLLVSVVSLILILRATNQARTHSVALQSEVNSLSQQEQALRKQAEAVKNSLSPEQLLTLEAAHTLVDRKHFSWSRLFADLESALPGNVRVKRIGVRGVAMRNDQTLAELELTVVAKTPTTGTDMIANMDRIGIFQAELRDQNLQTGKGESGTEYELYVVYRPRSGSPVGSSPLASVRPNTSVGGGSQ
jgi:Tfp pilus assembly protein PilN